MFVQKTFIVGTINPVFDNNVLSVKCVLNIILQQMSLYLPYLLLLYAKRFHNIIFCVHFDQLYTRDFTFFL